MPHTWPSVEYSTRAPLSRAVTDSVPSEVTRSVGLEPLSLKSDTTGESGGVVSGSPRSTTRVYRRPGFVPTTRTTWVPFAMADGTSIV